MSSSDRGAGRERRGGRRGLRILGAIVYWVVVVALSLALVVGLILVLESRDQSGVEGGWREPATLASTRG